MTKEDEREFERISIEALLDARRLFAAIADWSAVAAERH